MRLTVLSVAYPLAPVGPDAVGGAEQILHQLDYALTQAGNQSILVACEGSHAAGTLIDVPRINSRIDAQAKALAQAQTAIAVRHRGKKPTARPAASRARRSFAVSAAARWSQEGSRGSRNCRPARRIAAIARTAQGDRTAFRRSRASARAARASAPPHAGARASRSSSSASMGVGIERRGSQPPACQTKPMRRRFLRSAFPGSPSSCSPASGGGCR